MIDDNYGEQNIIERAINGGRGGYGMNANDKFDPKSANGKHNIWNIKVMQNNNINIKYCEVYEEKNEK
jgi:hypothetical protein